MIILILIIIIYYQLHIKKLKKNHIKEINTLTSKLGDVRSTNILREILEVSFEKESISKSSKKIIYILLKNYSIDYCTIFINHGGRLVASSSNTGTTETIKCLEEYVNNLINEISAVSGKKLYIENGVLSYKSAAERNVNFSFFIPLKNNGEVIGAVLIENVNYDDTSNDMGLEFFKVILETISITLQNMIYYDRIVSMALKDPLTKMNNRRCMDKVLGEYINSNKLFTIAMMDIDHFKKFNDTYGHAFGDLVLIEVSKFIKKQVENSGQVFRYGGEEFLICFDNLNEAESFKLLDTIRYGIANLTITNDQNLSSKVTASFGLAEYPKNRVKNTEELKELADQALYESKALGRNRVTIYNPTKHL